MDGRDGGAAQGGQGVEHAVAALDRFQHLALGRELLELAQVGADHEAGRLAGADDQALGGLDRDPLDDAPQFLQDLAAEAVGRLAGAVQGEQQDAVGAGLVAPVVEPQSLEHAGVLAALATGREA